MAGMGTEVGRISIKVVPDMDGFRDEVKRKLESIPDEKVGVDADTTRAKERIESLGDEEVEVKVDADTDAFQRRMLSDLKRFAGQIEAKIPLTPDGEQTRRNFEDHVRSLEKQIRAKIPVDLKTSAQSRAKIAADILVMKRLAQGGAGNEFGDFVDEIERAGDSAGSSGRKIMGLTRIGWIVTAVFAAAVPVIGLVASLLAGLPSLALAAGAGFAAVKLGMDGIKEAAKALQPAIDDLKTGLSDTFKESLAPVFQQLLPVFPVLKAGLQQVASGLTSMFQGFTNATTSTEGLRNISTILQGTGAFFQSLQPQIEQFTSSFLKIGAAGAQSFPILQGMIAQFATEWDAMVTKVTSNGVFEGAMQGLADTISPLLSVFTQLMDVGMQEMAKLGPQLGNMFTGLGDTLLALVPALSPVSGLLADVIGTLGTSLAPVISALVPGITALADTLGPILTAAMTTLSPILTQVAETLSTTLVTAMEALAPVLPGVMESFAQLGQTLTTQLAPILPQLAENFGTLLGATLQLAPSFLTLVSEAIIPMVPALVQLMTASLPIATAFAKMAEACAPLAGALMGILATGPAIAGAFTAMLGPIRSLVGGFQEVVAAIAEFIGSFVAAAGQAVATAANMVSQIIASLASMAGEGLKAGVALVQGVINGIGSLIGAAVAKARELASGVIGAIGGLFKIGSPSKVMHEMGQNVVQGFVNGLDQSKADAIASATSLASEISKAMEGGIIMPDFKDKLKQNLDMLELQKKNLKVQLDAIPAEDKAGKENLRSQIKELQTLKDQLSLQKEQLGYSEKYGQQLNQQDNVMGQTLDKLLSAGKGFAEANLKQFAGDIGISGNGALPQALDQGLQFGMSMLSKLITGGGGTTINVGSVDDALAIKKNQDAQAAMQMAGR